MSLASPISMSQKPFMQRYLVWPKLLYFMLYMAIYSANSLAAPYMVDNWKLKSSTVGFIMALQGVNFLGAIFWTSTADRTGKHRLLLVIGTMVSAFFLFVNGLPKMLQIKLSIPVDIAFTCIALACTWFFQAAMFPLLDSAMISLLSQDPAFSKDMFGMQRLFGSPAHPLATIVQGCTQFFDAPLKLYLYQAVAFGTSLMFAVCVMLGVPAHTPQAAHPGHGHAKKGDEKNTSVPMAEETAKQMAQSQRSPVIRLLTDPGFLFYIVFVVSAGLLANSLTIFQPILSNEIFGAKNAGGAPDKFKFLKTALAKIPAMISEIAVFFTSRSLMQSLGVYWLLLASQFFGIVRIMSYSFITKNQPSWFVYIFEILKGLNSGLIVTAGVRVASDMALPGCANTAQGLFSGCYKGISITLAGIIGGILLMLVDQNIKTMFFWVGCFAFCTTTAFFFKFLLVDRTIGLPCIPRREPNHERTTIA